MSRTADASADGVTGESVMSAARWVLKVIGVNAGWVLVRAICACRVVLHWLDPRVHVQSLRIRAVLDGRLVKGTGKFAVLVVYSDGQLPPFTQTFVDAVNRSDFDLIVVSNASLSPSAREELLGRCRLLIERVNIGRDFGGYKDGIAVVSRRFPNADRLLLANDSIFYLPEGLDEMIGELDSGDFTGVSEVFEHHYHVASFLVSFGAAVLRHPAFQRFWVRYRPIGTRRWAILRGEGELTRVLVAAGFQPRVLYRSEALRKRLQLEPAATLLSEVRSLPERARRPLLQSWESRCRRGRPADVSSGIAAEIETVVHARNQMHYGGFLFRRHLGLPLVKRDLVYRNVYSLPDALANLSDLEPRWLEAVAADFRRRPSPASFGLLRRLLHRHGAI